MSQKGTIKFFDDAKGIGLVRPDGGSVDVSFDTSALQRAGISHILVGDKIVFETEPDARGKIPKAINVQYQPEPNAADGSWADTETVLTSVAVRLNGESQVMRDWLAMLDADLDRIDRDNAENKQLLSQLVERELP